MTRRPLDGSRRITGDTASHAAYGVGPATDYGADEGEPVYAPWGGQLDQWWSPTGGNTVRVTDGGRKWIGQHLSAYTGGPGAVGEGWQIGAVGNTGSATSGPHLHNWVELNGVRMSMEDYLGTLGWAVAALNTRTFDNSIPIKTEDEDMPYLARSTNGPWAGLGWSISPGMLVCSPGPIYDNGWTGKFGPWNSMTGDDLHTIFTMNGIPWGGGGAPLWCSKVENHGVPWSIAKSSQTLVLSDTDRQFLLSQLPTIEAIAKANDDDTAKILAALASVPGGSDTRALTALINAQPAKFVEALKIAL